MRPVFIDPNIARIEGFITSHRERITTYFGRVPAFSSVEFSINGACNRRCIFCPRTDEEKFPNLYKSMPFDVFEKTMSELATVNYSGRISFSGFCEPLLTKNLEEYIASGRKHCPSITIEMVTNGDALTLIRLKRLFEAGLNNVRVSLYDGPHQDEKFLKMKEEANLTDKEFMIRRRYLPPEQTYGLTICNRAGAVNLKNEKIEVHALKEPLKQPCHYPFYKLMVDYDCSVMICSNDWLKKRIIGNLKDQTIFEVWDSESFHFARKNLSCNSRDFAPCNVCDVHGLYNGKGHFDAWVKYYDQEGKQG